MKSATFLLVPLLLISVTGDDESIPTISVPGMDVLQLHGSGTTGPSRCYWKIMETLTEQSSIPLRMTYRAVGTITGIDEFKEQSVNNNDASFTTSLNVFGSGDIPISQNDYNIITSNGLNKNFYHLPVLAGSVSFFHSVPDTPDLNLTACLISQIYVGQITSWGDPAITAINPNLSTDAQNITIRAIRRVRGSLTTAIATQYLFSACQVDSQKLPESLVGVVPDWSSTDTIGCEGSPGVLTCIQEQPGSIGYLDSAYGIAERLQEVQLFNQDSGTFRTSQTSSIQAAITRDRLPSSADDDFSQVNFLNSPGNTTWPMVHVTFIYVYKDLTSFIFEPAEQSLLVAFLRALYDDTYVSICEQEYGFTTFSGNVVVKSFVQQAIDNMIVDSSAPEWLFEINTSAFSGAGLYVFSTRRREISNIRIQELEDALDVLTGENGNPNIVDDVSTLSQQIDLMQKEIIANQNAIEELQVEAAVEGATCSCVLWFCFCSFKT